MIKLLLADDNAPIRESLAQMIALYAPGVQVVAQTESVSKTIAAIKKHTPDVVLLDIEMGDGTGFDVLRQFRTPSFKVIFVTAFRDHALDAFRFSALDYILKPVDPDVLSGAIHKAIDQIDREKISLKIDSFLHNMEHLHRGPKKIVIKTTDNIHLINMSDIMFCCSDQSYTTIHLSDGAKILASRNIGEFDEMFSPYNFLRIHQSYLVNINFVKVYEKGNGGQIVLKNNIALPVSTRKKEQLMQMLAKL